MTEHEIQVSLIAWARKCWPDTPIFAIPNGGQRNAVVAAKLKAEGVLAGIPDVLVADGKPGLFVELKTQRGRLSDKQHEQIERLKLIGYPVAVAYGLDDAKQKLMEYMNK